MYTVVGKCNLSGFIKQRLTASNFVKYLPTFTLISLAHLAVNLQQSYCPAEMLPQRIMMY